MDLNVRATFFVTQHAVAMMRDGGRVITISSMAGRIRQSGLSVYSASKAGVDALTRIWATELAPRQITVNSIQSGIVDTDIIRAMPAERREALVAMIPMGRIGQVGDIADVAAFLASDDSRWVSGAEIPASGGRYI
jgi:3-oxoacyl-[acyl-carrier protein] reductase